MQKKDCNRWIYLAAGTVLLMFCGMIYGWSMFRTPIAEMFPEWTLSQLSMTFTLSMSFFCIAGLVAGKLKEKINFRILLLAAGILMCAGFCIVSKLNSEKGTESLMLLYLGYGMLGGAGVGGAYNCIVSTMNQWFQDKQGFASGIMMMGFGVGALLFGGITEKLFASEGVLHTFFILGIAVLLFFIIGSIVIKPKNDVTTSIMGAKRTEKAVSDELSKVVNIADKHKNSVQHIGVADTSPTKMVCSISFWLFFVWLILLNAAGLMIINSAASIAQFYGAVAIVGMAVSVCNGLGRIIAGVIFDKIGRNMTMLYVICMLAVGSVCLVLGDAAVQSFLIIAGLAFIGLAFGGGPTLLSAYMNSVFGTKYFSVNFGIGSFAVIPAVVIATNFSAYSVEKSGGEYSAVFVLIAAFAIFAFGIWLVICKQDKQ